MDETLQDRGARVGSEVGHQVSEFAGRAREVAGEYVDKGKEMAQRGYRVASEKAQLAKRNTEGYIKENPWYAVGIALGVGVVLGMLIKSSRSNR